jgi:hypothetical protein
MLFIYNHEKYIYSFENCIKFQYYLTTSLNYVVPTPRLYFRRQKEEMERHVKTYKDKYPVHNYES